MRNVDWNTFRIASTTFGPISDYCHKGAIARRRIWWGERQEQKWSQSLEREKRNSRYCILGACCSLISWDTREIAGHALTAKVSLVEKFKNEMYSSATGQKRSAWEHQLSHYDTSLMHSVISPSFRTRDHIIWNHDVKLWHLAVFALVSAPSKREAKQGWWWQ